VAKIMGLRAILQPSSITLERTMLRSLAILVAIIGATSTTFAAERSFPFDSELMLDAKPMKGSKRIPVMTIGPNGKAEIDLWCNSVEGQVVVVESTITVMTGAKTERNCDPARSRGDDELLAALMQATTWSRDGDVLTLRGAKTLRFRQATN
jgi:heat shock protein HslJ